MPLLTPERVAQESWQRQKQEIQKAFLLNQLSREEAERRIAALKTTPGTREVKPQPETVTTRPPTPLEAFRALGLEGRLRLRPVRSGFRPQRQLLATVFPYQEGQGLTKLSRKMSWEWVQAFTSVSTASLQGKRLDSSQGRNAIAIIEHLRQKLFLRTDALGRPVVLREQRFELVGGKEHSLAAELGMSVATFYRALRHPLIHFFLKTQKVQRVEAGTRARRNVGTLFSVSLYEPLLPAALEEAYFSERVEVNEVLVVSDFNSHDERSKGRPHFFQKQGEACGKVTAFLGSACGVDGQGRSLVQVWQDQAQLVSRAGKKTSFDFNDPALEGCLGRLRMNNPALYEIAASLTIEYDLDGNHQAALIGYYKALLHLGVDGVKAWVLKLEKWRRRKPIPTPGKLLMSLLNKEALAATGSPIRDLGTETLHA